MQRKRCSFFYRIFKTADARETRCCSDYSSSNVALHLGLYLVPRPAAGRCAGCVRVAAGWPTRSRALALTALVLENLCFFPDFLGMVRLRKHDSCTTFAWKRAKASVSGCRKHLGWKPVFPRTWPRYPLAKREFSARKKSVRRVHIPIRSRVILGSFPWKNAIFLTRPRSSARTR